MISTISASMTANRVPFNTTTSGEGDSGFLRTAHAVKTTKL